MRAVIAHNRGPSPPHRASNVLGHISRRDNFEQATSPPLYGEQAVCGEVFGDVRTRIWNRLDESGARHMQEFRWRICLDCVLGLIQ